MGKVHNNNDNKQPANKKSSSTGNSASGPSHTVPLTANPGTLADHTALSSASPVDFSQASVSSFKAKLKDSSGTPDLTFDFEGIDQEHMTRDDGSVMDTESLHEHFGRTKLQYETLYDYVHRHRLELLQAYEEQRQRADILGRTLDQVHPADRITLQAFVQDQMRQADDLRLNVNTWDTQVPEEHRRIKDVLSQLLAFGSSDELSTLIRQSQWPSLAVCQDLQLPADYFLMAQGLFVPESERLPMSQGSPPALSEVDQLKQRIAYLESKQAGTKPVSPDGTKHTQPAPTNMTQVYVERRKRHRFTTFDKGTAFEAQQWLSRYEILAKYLGFSDREKIDELAAVLQGETLDWYIGLDPTIQDWNQIKQAFLHQNAHGLDPTLAAFNELKTYKQDGKPMKTFGPELKTLLQRAGIYQASIQLEYLKDRLHPELEKAVILNRPKTLDEAINVATEIERSLLRSQDTLYMGPVKTEPATMEQNNQNTTSRNHWRDKECYGCGKKGHIKRNCWATKKKLEHRQNCQECRSPTPIKIEPTDTDEENDDVFAHLMNTQDAANTATPYSKQQRFQMTVRHKPKQQPQVVLVDTGSTISTITRAKANQLNLQCFATRPEFIRYGNRSTQIATTKAVFDFDFEGVDKTRAFLLVVDVQNEDIILGMDWMIDEDMILQPKTKTVYKNREQMVNSTDLLIEELMNKYPKLTQEEEIQTITNAPYTHSIDTGSARPVVTRDYRRSPAENASIQTEVDAMLKKKVIVPSNSEWCSPVVLIKKPDGKFRFCVDYRNLNKVTVKDTHPLPLISDLLDQLQGHHWFSTCDLKSGFWQLPLTQSDGSAKKTAFQANGSLYEFTSMPYGCVNGPSSFTRLMKIVLQGLPRTIFFCDDCCVFSRTLEEHKEDVDRLLQRLQEFNLKISPDKSQWFQKEVKFLGFMVSNQGIRSNPDKTKVVENWQAPTTKKALLRFLGFAVFYHKFIEGLSSKAKPLYHLLKKDVPYNWTTTTQTAFDLIKKELVTLPTLAYPNPRVAFDLHCDASQIGLGACLVQAGRPIAFASRTLNQAEINYSTTEKECLAIVWSLRQFHPYVYGSSFTIYTDHAALKSILSTKMPRGRIARWIMALQDYQPFTIVHKKGIHNQDADALSRLHDTNIQDLTELNNATMKDLQQTDPFIKLLLKEGIQVPYTWKNDIVCYRDRKNNKELPVIPLALKEMVLTRYHDSLIGGHFGLEKTLEKIKTIGWWPHMTNDVDFWIKSCEKCQHFKINNKNNRPAMTPISPMAVGQIWATDLATLKTSKHGNKYLLVIMEYVTKWAITVPLKSCETQQIVQVLLYEVVLKYGLPSKLISDNGSNYISEAMNMVCQRLGIARSLTSVEHPQTDGLVERYNRTIKTSLALVAGHEQREWCTNLPFVTFAYNTAKQSSTQYSPFEVMYGRQAVLPILPSLDPSAAEGQNTQEWRTFLNEKIPLIHAQAIDNIQQAQEYQARQYNKRTNPNPTIFNDGDQVLRRNQRILSFPKERWTGPWTIIQANNQQRTSYKISKVSNPNMTSTANAYDLKLFVRRENGVILSKPTQGTSPSS